MAALKDTKFTIDIISGTTGEICPEMENAVLPRINEVVDPSSMRTLQNVLLEEARYLFLPRYPLDVGQEVELLTYYGNSYAPVRRRWYASEKDPSINLTQEAMDDLKIKLAGSSVEAQHDALKFLVDTISQPLDKIFEAWKEHGTGKISLRQLRARYRIHLLHATFANDIARKTSRKQKRGNRNDDKESIRNENSQLAQKMLWNGLNDFLQHLKVRNKSLFSEFDSAMKEDNSLHLL